VFFWLNLSMRAKNDFLTKRRMLFLGILSLALVLIIGLIVIKKKITSASDPLTAVPLDASIILQINDLQNFKHLLFDKNLIWKDLSKFEAFDKMFRIMSFTDSVAKGMSGFSDLIYQSTIYISGHFIGGRKTEFLYIFSCPTGENARQSINVLEKITGQNIRKTERKYEGESIYTLEVNTSPKPIHHYVSIVEGNILLSKSVILIENAIRQYSLPRSLLNDTEFMAIYSTAGKNKEANLYVDLRKFTGILSTLGSENFRTQIKDYQNFSSWMELDLTIADKQLMLNGFISMQPQSNRFGNMFEDNLPITIDVDKVLPVTVSTFYSVGAEDFRKLQQKFAVYLKDINAADKRTGRLKEIERRYNIQLDELFLSFIDNELTIAHGSYPDRSISIPSSYVLVKCRNGEQTGKKMQTLVETIGSQNGKSFQQLTHTYTIDNESRYSLVEFPLEDITGLLFGGLFSMKGKTYYTLLGNYLVFCDSKEALGDFLYNNMLSRTLSTNEAYKAFSSNIVQKSFFIAYTNLSRSALYFEKYLYENILEAWEENIETFQKIQPLGFQLTRVSNMNYINLITQYLEEYNGKPSTVWESLLDTTFTFKPQLVENHYSKQKEIFLQDQNHSIYLINKAGRVLWKQKIAEPIKSKIFQVDYFRNGKLQLLFSTENFLHLIDRNGNYVERYPIRLRDRATAGMALFDYEKNRDYRILISCADNKVYTYSIEGNIIPGWQFPGSDYPVEQPAEHFRFGDKDFIVLGDKYAVYILDRRGNTRLTPDKLISKSRYNTFYLEENESIEKSRILTTDTAGNVISIYLDGKTSSVSIESFSAEHFFDFKDVDADGERDYIFLDDNVLHVYRQDKTEIYNFSFPNRINDPPVYFNFSHSDRKLGIADATDRKIYLINNDGLLFHGFPLEGSTLFSIGYLENSPGQFNLIVGGRNNFLYNYSVK
jgi:hypothetical protein